MKHMHLLVAALALTILGVGTASAQTTVTATWERNTDSYTAGYRLYYGTSPGSYQWSVDAGNNVTVPVTVAESCAAASPGIASASQSSARLRLTIVDMFIRNSPSKNRR